MGVPRIQSNFAETYPEYGASNCVRHMVSPGLDGLRVNVDKSEACWIGKAKGRTDKPLKCR